MRQAASLVEQKKLAEAAEVYAAIPERFPKSEQRAAALLAAGNCYDQSGDLDAAIRVFRQAAAGDDPAALDAVHWLARTYLKKNEAAGALAAVDGALAKAKDTDQAPRLLLDRADALYALPDRRGDSIAAYALVAEKYPEHELAPQAGYLAAYASLEQGDYAAAARHADAFLQAYAGEKLAADVRYIAAEAALQRQQYAAAARQYRELLDGHPDHADRARWNVRLALAQFLDGKPDAVVANLSPLVVDIKSPDLAAEAQYLLGSAQADLGQTAAAIASLKASLAAEPQGPRPTKPPWCWRRLTRRAARPTRRSRPCGSLSPISPTASDSIGPTSNSASTPSRPATTRRQLRITNICWPRGPLARWRPMPCSAWPAPVGRGRFRRRRRFADQIPPGVRATRARRAAHYLRGVARQRQGAYAEAVKDLKAYLASNPPPADRLDALYVEGLSLAGLQQFDQATASFRAVLAADKNYAAADKALYELAWALKSSGKADEALAAFQRLAREHADSPLAAESFYHLGEAAYERKDYPQAATNYEAARTKAGQNDLGEKAAHKLAWSRYQQGDLAAATQAFQQQLADFSTGPLAADAQFMIAEALFGQQKYEAAVDAYQRSFARPSDNPQFQALAHLHAAQTLAQQEKWDASLELLGRAIEKFPNSVYLPELRYESAWALQNLGRADEALARYKQVVAETDREVSARARFMIGEILFEKREYKEAIRNFFKVAYGYGYPDSPDSLHTWQANASYEAGRCFEVLRMVDQAKKSYQEVLDKYPASDKASLAKGRLEALGS